jgi:hypothetical protein
MHTHTHTHTHTHIHGHTQAFNKQQPEILLEVLPCCAFRMPLKENNIYLAEPLIDNYPCVHDDVYLYV